MNLKQLLEAMNAATAALEADPENAELKAKAEEAKTAYEAAKAEQGDEPSGDDLDDSKLDEKTKNYIEKLRKENAKHRTKNKELDSKFKVTSEQFSKVKEVLGLTEEESPEEQLKQYQSHAGTLELRNAILTHAVAHGIGAEGLDYFNYLVERKLATLGEDEELDEDGITELAQKAKSVHGKSGSGNTSVGQGQGQGKQPPSPGGKEAVSLEDFCAMGMTEKSNLYGKDPALYERLRKEAIAKNRFIK